MVENQVESMQLVGDVKGMTCFIIDDIIDTVRNNNTSLLLICFLSEYIYMYVLGGNHLQSSVVVGRSWRHQSVRIYSQLLFVLWSTPHCRRFVLTHTHTLFSCIDRYGVATHGVFSGPAMDRLNASKLQEIWVCSKSFL